MAIVMAEGFAKPYDSDGQAYTAFGNQIPALRSFYLGYDVGDATPGDHQINLIQVLAGGESDDLSPNAEGQPVQIPEGRLHVALQDKSPANEEFFYRVSHSTIDVVGARRFQIRDVGCVSQCVRKLSIPTGSGVPAPVRTRQLFALVGFKLFFTGARDHELDRIGIWFVDDNLHVAMRDANGDDTFGYVVDFIAIPTLLLNVSTAVHSGSARGGQKVTYPNSSRSQSFLTGWEFNFRSGDHHIRDIGIDRGRDDFTVYYGDKNADDWFDWRVEWAHVGPLVNAPQ